MTKGFFREQSGAVVIETAFLFVLIITLIQLLVEFSIYKQQQTALERVNFVMAKVVRERNALYGASPLLVFKQSDLLTQNDVARLAELGKVLLQNSEYDFTLRVEAIVFADTANATNATVAAKTSTISTYSSGNSCTIPNLTPLSDYGRLSAWTNNGRWMPIYRVSLCMPRRNSFIEQTINRTLGFSEAITVSNIVLSR